MVDPVIRPAAGLLLFALQTAEGTPAVPSALTDCVPVETDSVDYNSPYKMEQSNESNGSLAAASPMVVGQPSTISFRARLKGAGAGTVYSPTVRPPLHAPLSACGWMGQYTAAIAAMALTAGTAQSATLGNNFAATAQLYRGMPLVLAGAPAAGRLPLIADYSAARVATLTDAYSAALSAGNTAALPANWLYTPTTPVDPSARASMHPCGTIQWFEDGSLHTWTDCRGTVDLDGNSGKPGFAAFSFTGIYQGRTDAPVSVSAVYAGQSAPLLAMGAGTAPAFQVARRGLAISQWSLKSGSNTESPDDPNTPIGFGGGQLGERAYMLEIDPLVTQVATRNSLADIAAYSQYPAGIQLGNVSGNRVSIMVGTAQPVETSPSKRGALRAETLRYQAIITGRDPAGRDGDVSICFS